MCNSSNPRLLIILQVFVCLLASVLPALAQNNGGGEIARPDTPAESKNTIVCPSAVDTESYKAARKELIAGHYDQYVHMLSQAGADGDLQCQNELGNLFYRGRIVQMDPQKAFEIWLALSAKQYGPASYRLGVMYDNGIGVPVDYKRAMELFSQSAATGYDLGTVGMARIYRLGHGCRKDITKALALYDQLCAQNSPWGWLCKGAMLWDGSQIAEDPLTAIKYIKKAAEAGLPEAQYWLAYRFHRGEKISPDYKLAQFWAQRGSDQADVDCQALLAHLKMNGDAGEKDCAGGLKLLKELAAQNLPEGQTGLAYAYNFGNCVKQDSAAAKFWYEKAVARDFAEAENYYSYMYFYGVGVPTDLTKYFELNMKAARQDYTLAQFTVARAYEEGWGVKKDLNQARIWYAKAVVGGSPHACNNLSCMYLSGQGCPVDKELGMRLRRLGAKNGCPMACYNLGQDYFWGTNDVRQNIFEATRLYKRAVEINNYSEANYMLGIIYENGMTVKADQQQALRYYREAAKGGSKHATVRLKDIKLESRRKKGKHG